MDKYIAWYRLDRPLNGTTVTPKILENIVTPKILENKSDEEWLTVFCRKWETALELCFGVTEIFASSIDFAIILAISPIISS